MNYSIIQRKYCNSTGKFLKNVENLYDTLGPQESLSEVFETLYTLGKNKNTKTYKYRRINDKNELPTKSFDYLPRRRTEVFVGKIF